MFNRYKSYKRALRKVEALSQKFGFKYKINHPAWADQDRTLEAFERGRKFREKIDSGKAFPQMEKMSHRDMVDILIGGNEQVGPNVVEEAGVEEPLAWAPVSQEEITRRRNLYNAQLARRIRDLKHSEK